MEVNEAQEVKQLREENARLKKLVADLSLCKDMLQSKLAPTWSHDCVARDFPREFPMIRFRWLAH